MAELYREPMKVAFISTEDSVTRKLRKRLREAGADLSNIITMDLSQDKDGLMRDFKFGSPYLAEFIRYYRPAVCVFDPLQGFIPADLNMGSRNAMRDCMAPLVGLGEECHCTFIVICHTNKRHGASGRFRVSDSADIWDISRSVIMAGYTNQDGIRYLSHEKSNYSKLQDSILYSVNDYGQIVLEGRTWKHDSDFVADTFSGNGDQKKQVTPDREACSDLILNTLTAAGGSMASVRLEEIAQKSGFTRTMFRRTRELLIADNLIEKYHPKKSDPWFIRLIEPPDHDDPDVQQYKITSFQDLPDDTETPFDE